MKWPINQNIALFTLTLEQKGKRVHKRFLFHIFT